MATKKKDIVIKEKYTKAQIVADIADSTGVTRKHVAAVIDELGGVIERHIKKRAVGAFVLPGLLKISTIRKPATKERKGINPFTGQETVFKARPARTVVKVRPLKRLKEMAQ
ncbi:MAG: HU family DNA-binding protein [Deltaproteobacteria bacterium]|nr:HU family DNA-binding protein [Deltaproteobacteria bacterium]